MLASGTDLVRVIDHSFGVLDSGIIPSGDEDYSNGLIIVMSAGVRIHTGVSAGPVRVFATAAASNPQADSMPDAGWTEIIEASVHAPLGRLCVDSLADGPVATLPLLSPQGPGWYRISVRARGRDTDYDAVVDEPVEEYHITVWPAAPSPSRIIRAQDQCGHGMRLSARSRSTRAPLPAAPSPAIASEEERQATIRSNLLRSMGATQTPRPDESARPWKPGPDQPAPRPPWADDPRR